MPSEAGTGLPRGPGPSPHGGHLLPFSAPATLVGLTGSRSGCAEIKLGKNRTEAEVKRYTEEKERLERQKEEIRAHLAQLRKDKRELKESLSACTGGRARGFRRSPPSPASAQRGCLLAREQDRQADMASLGVLLG